MAANSRHPLLSEITAFSSRAVVSTLSSLWIRRAHASDRRTGQLARDQRPQGQRRTPVDETGLVWLGIETTSNILIDVEPQLRIHRVVRLKGRSSRLLRDELRWLKSPTLWTHSYFVSTVGGAPLAVIRRYIENRKNV